MAMKERPTAIVRAGMPARIARAEEASYARAVTADPRLRTDSRRTGRRPAGALGIVLLGLVAAPAGADIYRWTDADGVAHYTNHPEAIPDGARGDAPFVRERPRAPAPPAPAAEPEVAARSAEPVSETVPMDERVATAFAAGVEAGSRDRDPPVVEVHAPPVVQNVIVEAPDPGPRWIGAPLFPVHPPRERRRPAPPLERRRPADRTPFVVGPAGPAPLGAPGPAPVTFD